MTQERGNCPVIIGPTAVGKTTLISRLAGELPLEVISLDSRQIYRGLRIGTAQPTAEEQAACPHHLIDFHPPEEKFDAIRYRREFERVFQEISKRGATPILVGGAGMYLTALREGFMEIPGSTPEAVATARAEFSGLDDREIRQRLHEIDPVSLSRIHSNDRYRCQRALEIHSISGQTMSELKASQKPDPCLGLEFPTFVLERPVPVLDQRIARRTELMLDSGWIDETRAALQKHPTECPGLLSIGYREIVRMLSGEIAESELAAAIVQVTRQYAKRQRTWFRKVAAEYRGLPEDAKVAAAISNSITG